jgi:hypothetical protein
MALRRIGTDIAPVRRRRNVFAETKNKKKNGSREESRETRDGGGTDARENAAVGTSNAQGRVEFRRIAVLANGRVRSKSLLLKRHRVVSDAKHARLYLAALHEEA